MEFSEGLKKVFLAGVGAVATTAEAAKDVVDQLVTKGEITVEQGKVLNKELKHSVKEKVNEHVTVNIVRDYKDVMSAVEHMSKEDRDKLREKLDAAEAQEADANTDEEKSCESTEGTDDAKTDAAQTDTPAK